MGLNSVQTARNSPGRPRCSVGILGFGGVGSAVVRRLTGPDAFPDIRLTHICDRRAREKRARQPDLARDVVWTDRFDELITSDTDVIVEVVTGVEPAVDYVRAALLAGKSVVTANRDVIAHQGPALLTLAERQGRQLRYGAAVGGAMPLVRVLGDGLAGERIVRVEAILNGATNAVLSQMEASGCSVDEAVADACARGYAEANPSNDLDGVDAAAKLAIVCALAFGVRVAPGRVDQRTTTHLRPEKFREARLRGGTIRQIARSDYDQDSGELSVWVAPIVVPADSAFGRAHGPENAAVITGRYGGALTVVGTGAGADALAVAVLGDLAAIARDRAAIVPAPTLVDPLVVKGLLDNSLAEAV